MFWHRFPLLLVLAALFTGATSGFSSDRLDGMDACVSAAMERWDVPGLALAVVKDGRIVVARGYGRCEVGSNRAVTEHTLFDIASCEKSFTAAAIGVLVDQKRLAWDDPVIKHLVDFRFSEPYLTENATLLDLLCHRTGLRRADLLCTRGDVSRDELVRRVRFLPPEAPFRTQSIYSNLMYATLAEVVATVSGQPYEVFVARQLLAPLEMRSTTHAVGKADRKNFAPRHWQDDGKLTSREPALDEAPTASAGALCSSATDMAHWLECQLNQGRYQGRRVLSPEVVSEMHAMHHAIPVRNRPSDNPYAARFLGAGLGWLTCDYRGRKLVMHSGSWGAIVGMVPEERLGVVVLSNLDWNGLTGMLMFRILDAFCTENERPWDTSNFARFDAEGPGHAYRALNRQRKELREKRKTPTLPALHLDEYAGSYASDLMGDVRIMRERDGLVLRIGRFSTPLAHWETDTFYARTPLQLNFDFLVQFRVDGDRPDRLTLRYVGWHEEDVVFQRVTSTR